VLGEDFRPLRQANPGGVLARVSDEVGDRENFVHFQVKWHQRKVLRTMKQKRNRFKDDFFAMVDCPKSVESKTA
jgi:hypothetical protein